MPLAHRHGPINTRVALHPEVGAAGRAAAPSAGTDRIYWAQCPRCHRRYWYALHHDTGATEAQRFGKGFRERFRAEECPAHSLAPLPSVKTL